MAGKSSNMKQSLNLLTKNATVDGGRMEGKNTRNIGGASSLSMFLSPSSGVEIKKTMNTIRYASAKWKEKWSMEKKVKQKDQQKTGPRLHAI